MQFNDKVVYARVKLNISQTKLADMLNVSLATISRWETKKAAPTKKDEMMFYEFCKENKIFFKEEYSND